MCQYVTMKYRRVFRHMCRDEMLIDVKNLIIPSILELSVLHCSGLL